MFCPCCGIYDSHSPHCTIYQETEEFISLRNMAERDEYSRVLDMQNDGQSCPHCDCPSGHYVTCPLINRASSEDMAEKRKQIYERELTRIEAYTNPQISESDSIILHGLGVRY
jgi:hypothetical protein